MLWCSFPIGLCALQVIPHDIPQPSTAFWILAFSSQCLLGPYCSPSEVVRRVEVHRLIGYLYTRGVFTFLLCAFTAHPMLYSPTHTAYLPLSMKGPPMAVGYALSPCSSCGA